MSMLILIIFPIFVLYIGSIVKDSIKASRFRIKDITAIDIIVLLILVPANIYFALDIYTIFKRNKIIAQIESFENKWSDSLKVASSTPRIGLSSQVNNLQSIRRDFTELNVDRCLGDAKDHLLEHMGQTIDSFIYFMQDKEHLAKSYSSDSVLSLLRYRTSLSKCIR